MAAPPGPAYNFASRLNFARRVIRDVWVGWGGLKEGVVEVAERLSRRVQLLKRSAEASEFERSLDELYRQLGHRIEEYRTGGPDGGNGGQPGELTPLPEDHEVTRLVAASLEVKAGLDRVERQIRILKAEGRDDDLTIFLEALRRTSGRVEVVVLPADSPAIGMSVGELHLPDEVRLVGLQHEHVVSFPRPESPESDDTRLSPGDRLLMIGLDRPMDEVVARLAWSRPSGEGQPRSRSRESRPR